MKREQRLGLYRQSLQSGEREAATRLQGADAKLAEAKNRLEQLAQYKGDYEGSFGPRVAQGMNGRALLDFQAFIARLADAIRQQESVVAQLELERVQLQHKLRDVAVQNRAVGAVVERWRTEDRQSDNRREQREIDERAQRPLRVAAADA
jgi:flagellar FliJ protein